MFRVLGWGRPPYTFSSQQPPHPQPPPPPPPSAQELGILCGMLGYKCSARNLVHLLNSVDRDGNGQISLHEFLLWWAGN